MRFISKFLDNFDGMWRMKMAVLTVIIVGTLLLILLSLLATIISGLAMAIINAIAGVLFVLLINILFMISAPEENEAGMALVFVSTMVLAFIIAVIEIREGLGLPIGF